MDLYPSRADAYTLIAQIGTGAFATVFSAEVVESKEKVAIKIIPLEEITFNLDEVRNEIKTLRLLKHENVVPICTSFVDEDELWLVMPLMEAGSCARIIKTNYPNGIKDEAVVLRILQEILLGLKYLHSDGRIHRDIKAGNVLISKEGDVKLADFGVAGTLTEHGQRRNNRNTFVGTPCWMAPEVMEQQDGHNHRADLWSVGITALELAYGRAPYAHFPPMKVLILTLQEDPPTADIYRDSSYKFSSDFHKFVDKCLRKDPRERRSVEYLLEKFDKVFKRACTKDEFKNRFVLPNLPQETDVKDVRGLDRQSRRKDSARKVAPLSWNFGIYASLKKEEIQGIITTESNEAVEAQLHAKEVESEAAPQGDCCHPPAPILLSEPKDDNPIPSPASPVLLLA